MQEKLIGSRLCVHMLLITMWAPGRELTLTRLSNLLTLKRLDSFSKALNIRKENEC